MSSAPTEAVIEVPRLILKDGEARRIRRGHPWIYGNELVKPKDAPSQLAAFEPGDVATLTEEDGSFVAWVDVSPKQVLCARVTSRRGDAPPDEDWLRGRLMLALEMRQWFRQDPFYRWVYGDADNLPGLVIDRFDDVLVMQVSTAAMERRLETLLDILEDLVAPRAIVLKNDSRSRTAEGLEQYVRVARGQVTGPIPVVENGVAMLAPVLDGQKTGWYFDHADNRRWLMQQPGFAAEPSASVLDLFSYVGAWSLPAAQRGAQVTSVDSSAAALGVMGDAAARLGLTERLELRHGDVWAQLGELTAQSRRFDVVICDPPAFITRKADMAKGKDAYRRLTAQSVRLLKPGGLLVSASCSSHLTPEDHLATVRTGTRQAQRRAVLVYRGSQAPDHPIHPMLPQSDYLKCLFLKVY